MRGVAFLFNSRVKLRYRLALPHLALACIGLPLETVRAADPVEKVPRFAIENMGRSVDPSADFYRFAAGTWLKNNPVPADKSRWSGFDELQQRNWALIRSILESSTTARGPVNSPQRQVGDFFASSMDTNRIEKLGFAPIAGDLRRIDNARSLGALFQLFAQLHERGVSAFFSDSVTPDAKDSSIYTYALQQGGLGLPDRDYYLSDKFAKERQHYREHIKRMLGMLGEKPAEAAAHAQIVLEIESALAKASRTRVDLRDPNANYNKLSVSAFISTNSGTAWPEFFAAARLGQLKDLVVGQPEFFAGLSQTLKARPLADWKVYLRWHVVSGAAPYLHRAAEQESFAFYGTSLRGQPEQEPRWQRAAHVIDGGIGEALGKLYVDKYFPPAAKARMNDLVDNLKEVFRGRLQKLEWMSESTRAKALAKLDRFTQKIGHPDTFRDYSNVVIRRDDYLGNVQRAAVFESRRELARIGKTVDRAEWHMTPQTVNAYFNPLQNEIVFPAGILQPPFFDLEADDAVNYGAIGVVIGHEMTHGYDDKGRQYDAEGNLNDWWTEQDAKEFDARAQKLIAQYGSYEAMPGLMVNGRLTLGENIADLGGTSVAYEALERALAKEPGKRKSIDGFTPEQRFFLSLAQLWRTNWREAEIRRRVTVDPHSPGQFRAVGPHVNLAEFYDAFGIKEGAPMWRAPELRAKIW